MKIKELHLNNFASFYGEKSFSFTDGFNIILGANGEGKSTFFRALKWILKPSFQIDLYASASKKKIYEIDIDETFDVSVKLIVEQYNQDITIEKRYTITKNGNNTDDILVSPLREAVFVFDKITGETDTSEKIIRYTNRIFPVEFLNFSMFDTEKKTLDLVEGSNLYDLINSFSDSRYFDSIIDKSTSIYKKASREYQRASNLSNETKNKIEEIDELIKEKEKKIVNLRRVIKDDQEGYNILDAEVKELAAHSKLSEELNEIDAELNIQKEQKKNLQKTLKNNNNFNNYIFDNIYCLIGYNKYLDRFSEKINDVRKARNIEEARLTKEHIIDESKKLVLKDDITPLPPGSPSEEILVEFLNDNTCKICSRELDDEAKIYIEKSLKIYKEINSNNNQESEIPEFFYNDFVAELFSLSKSLRIDYRQKNLENINDLITDRIELCNSLQGKIIGINSKIEDGEKKIEKILSQVSTTKEYLLDIIRRMPQISESLRRLTINIANHKKDLENQEAIIEKKDNEKSNILAQLPETNFKYETVKLLKSIEEIFNNTKKREYDKFLTHLEEKSTEYLSLINRGDDVGRITYEKSESYVSINRLNNDGTLRFLTEDNGAIEISVPMSILLAIADMASEIYDETYPMIFDAPTGRLDDSNSINFYNAIYNSTKTKSGELKQRIIVTLDFLKGGDENIHPKIDMQSFDKIEKDNAYWITRERKIGGQTTINTLIKKL